MTVQKLHEITAALIANKRGDIEVMIDFATFEESENGSILDIETAIVRRVQGCDDSGPVGRKHNMLVLSGRNMVEL